MRKIEIVFIAATEEIKVMRFSFSSSDFKVCSGMYRTSISTTLSEQKNIQLLSY
jgi:hypothetical protein